MNKKYRRGWAREHVEEIQTLLDEGRNIAYIAAALNVHHEIIRRAIDKAGIEVYVAFDEIDKALERYDEWDFEDALDSWARMAWDGENVLLPKPQGRDDIYTLELYRCIRDNYGGLDKWMDKRCRGSRHRLFWICSTCLAELPIGWFPKREGSSLTGRAYTCKSCTHKQRNPESYRASANKRRSLKLELPSEWGLPERQEMLQTFGEACVLTRDVNYEDEHFIPVSLGQGGTYVGNMYPLRSILNRSKRSKHPFDWFEANRQRFELDQSRFDSLVAKLAEQNGLTSEEFREYTDWCFANPRNLSQIKQDNERYGYLVTSVELWREATGRLRIESVS